MATNMKIMFYMDWGLAITYLKPIYQYFQQTTDWELFFSADDEISKEILQKKKYPTKARDAEYDWSICCDKMSICPSKNRIVVFHGIASKGQDYCKRIGISKRIVNPTDISIVPSGYYRKLYINKDGADKDKVIVGGISKFDTIKEIPPKNKIPKVLYAPTHNIQLSAAPVLKDSIYEIENLTVHLHYWTRTNPKNLPIVKKDIYPIHDEREDITELMLHSDIVIADMGSVVLEAMALGKMVIQVVNPLYREFYRQRVGEEHIDEIPEIDLPKRFAYQAHNIEEVKEIIKKYPEYKIPDFPIIEHIGNYETSKIIRDYISSR